MQDQLANAAAKVAGRLAAAHGREGLDGLDDEDLPIPTGDPALPAVIMIRYHSSHGEVSERAVAIHHVWRDAGELYLQGVCQLRHALRTFRVDRIEELTCLATGEVSDRPADWLAHHAFLQIADAADYTPHALRGCRDQLAVLAFVARADGCLDPDEVEVCCDLVMLSTEKQIDRAHVGRYLKRLTPTAVDLEGAVDRLSRHAEKWDALRRAMRRLVDADRVWPIEEQLSVQEIEDLHAAAVLRFGAPGGPEVVGRLRAELGARVVIGLP